MGVLYLSTEEMMDLILFNDKMSDLFLLLNTISIETYQLTKKWSCLGQKFVSDYCLFKKSFLIETQKRLWKLDKGEGEKEKKEAAMKMRVEQQRDLEK